MRSQFKRARLRTNSVYKRPAPPNELLHIERQKMRAPHTRTPNFARLCSSPCNAICSSVIAIAEKLPTRRLNTRTHRKSQQPPMNNFTSQPPKLRVYVSFVRVHFAFPSSLAAHHKNVFSQLNIGPFIGTNSEQATVQCVWLNLWWLKMGQLRSAQNDFCPPSQPRNWAQFRARFWRNLWLTLVFNLAIIVRRFVCLLFS